MIEVQEARKSRIGLALEEGSCIAGGSVDVGPPKWWFKPSKMVIQWDINQLKIVL